MTTTVTVVVSDQAITEIYKFDQEPNSPSSEKHDAYSFFIPVYAFGPGQHRGECHSEGGTHQKRQTYCIN